MIILRSLHYSDTVLVHHSYRLVFIGYQFVLVIVLRLEHVKQNCVICVDRWKLCGD